MLKSRIKLCVATPMYGGQCFGAFMVSVMNLRNLCVENNCDFAFTYIGSESLIPRARNWLVEKFLEIDFTHLLFIDGDMEFDAAKVLSLLKYDVEVICGLCPKKQINWEAVKTLVISNPEINPELIPKSISNSYKDNNVNFFGVKQESKIPDLIPVQHAGTGCMLIKKEVFLKLMPSIPKYKYYGPDGGAIPVEKYLFFDTKVDTEYNRYLSEDYYFCDEWRKIGGTIYLAPHVRLSHIGIHTYY